MTRRKGRREEQVGNEMESTVYENEICFQK